MRLKALLTVLLATPLPLLLAPAAPAHAGQSVAYGVEIPIPVYDLATGCTSTGAVTMYAAVDYGPLGSDVFVAHESFRAKVDSPVCPMPWSVHVAIIDVSPGYDAETIGATGMGSAAVAQDVRYAQVNLDLPKPTRGAADVRMEVSWSAPNGVKGCISNSWALAPFAVPVETGPVAPCFASSISWGGPP
jgi:hypothetical protein